MLHRSGLVLRQRNLWTYSTACKPRFARLLSSRASNVLSALGLPTADPLKAEPIPGVYDGAWLGSGEVLESVCPATGEVLGKVATASPSELHATIGKAKEAQKGWRAVPPPRRGEILRQVRDGIAAKRAELGALVSLEMGKIRTEGEGEVQEIIDICDYAVGLSRMMNGRVVASERPGHAIYEVPNPLGVVGVLSAFNFPVAVYGWNLALSLPAGNATLWKPAPSTSLCAIAVTKIVSEVLERNGLPGALTSLVCGGKDVGEAVVQDEAVNLVSFTGSEAVGRHVGKLVQSRFGKVILELGGNNAAILAPSAPLHIALPAIFFGAVGTAGQRCTSTRRVFVHRSIYPSVLKKLESLYNNPKFTTPGDPLRDGTMLGPVHSANGIKLYESAVQRLKNEGAQILAGGEAYTSSSLPSELSGGNFVKPVLSVPPQELSMDHPIWREEVFAPILNVKPFDELQEAIEWNNAVPQGLSSSLFTNDVKDVGTWLGAGGSDCGIVNINVGTSGAEVGAAFGGNKSTGWGRESGGDAWKQYVRWSACTVNFSDVGALAQGVKFDVE